jgi:hypothetical protein
MTWVMVPLVVGKLLEKSKPPRGFPSWWDSSNSRRGKPQGYLQGQLRGDQVRPKGGKINNWEEIICRDTYTIVSGVQINANLIELASDLDVS